ncbi:MAG: hypothetical protein LBI69_00400 [Puniceicoccales bacterium]|nr:hypothetical protein [Puniceicoccales bacterium]
MLEIILKIDNPQTWFTPKEVAAVLGRTDQFVRDLLENRRIFGYALFGRGESERKSYQIHRRFLELYLLETANFSPEEHMEHILCLIDRLPKKQREWIRRQMATEK